MKRIVLLGARKDAHAGVLVDIIRKYHLYEILGFFDDNEDLVGKNVLGIPVLGTIKQLPQHLPDSVDGFFICIGDNQSRANCYHKIKDLSGELVNIIHPSAIISDNIQMGTGIFIGPRVIINHNSRIGDNVIINSGAIIEHDNILENHTFIGPGCNLAGRVTVQEMAFLGIGCSVIPDIIIGRSTIVGAGAVVVNNLASNITAVGVPAKKIKGGSE